jgi:hypothetical protein
MAMVRQETRIQRSLGLLKSSLLSVAVGVVSGLGAVIFRALIVLFSQSLLPRTISTAYDANVHTADSTWGPMEWFDLKLIDYRTFGILTERLDHKKSGPPPVFCGLRHSLFRAGSSGILRTLEKTCALLDFTVNGLLLWLIL